MYISLLKLNPSSRKAMVEAARPYELHRSLMRAFPDKQDGGSGRVLFRLDVDRKNGGMFVLVQSQNEPNWKALNGWQDFLMEEPRCKIFDPAVAVGQVLYFRLRANPSVKRNGKRLGILREEEQIRWLERKAKQSGFEILSLTLIPEGMAHDKTSDESGSSHDISLLSVRFEGFLRVTDADKFKHSLECGLGSAKGLGFGLLSIAPLKDV